MLIKKLTAAMLSSAVLLMNMPFGNIVQAQKTGNESAVLNAMGISAVDSDGYITRGDFTVLMVQASGMEHEGMTTDLFSDVSGEQSEYIAAASMLGYVNGIEEGRFYPDNIISVNDALTIALRVLGFGEYTQSDTRENMIALLELSDSIPTSGNLKCSDASILIMNMLESGYAVHNGQELDVSEESFMYKAHGVYRTRGTMNGAKGISLSGYPEIDNDEICLDKNIYRNEADAGYEYLGSDVTVYIKEYENYDAVIWFGGTARESITLTSDEIDAVEGFDKNDTSSPYVAYSENESRSKTEYVEGNAMVYINRVNTVSVSNADLMPESGKVMLIDSDSNGSSDIVIIEKYDYYMVEAVDYDSQIIYSEDKPEIKMNSFSEDDISIIYDGKSAEFEEIKSGIVLAVMCTYKDDGKIDDDKQTVIEILNGNVSGQVDFVGSDNRISVNNTEYRYIASLDEIPEAGRTAVFYLGKLGEVVYWKTDISADGLEYGYLMRLIPSDDGDSTYAIIFDTKGTKHKLMVDDTDKVIYSGELNDSYVLERRISRKEFDTVFNDKQLVRFAKSGERLTRIHKAVDETADSSYAGYDEERFSLDHKSSNERLYAQFLSENYKISTQTIMVGVSKNSNTDDDIAIGGYDYFGTDLSGLNIKLYDSGKTFVPAVVVITFDNLNSSAKKPNNNFVNTKFAALITKRYTKINSDNEIVTAYEAYCGGVLVNIEPEDDGVYDVKGTNWSGEAKKYFKDLEPGDVIQYGVNSQGQVDLLHVIHDHDDLTPRYTMFNSNNHISEMNTAFGKVTEFESGSYFKLDSSATRKYPFGRYKPNIYLYNTNSGTFTRLLTMTNLTEDDYVFVRCARADVKDIVIYRNE